MRGKGVVGQGWLEPVRDFRRFDKLEQPTVGDGRVEVRHEDIYTAGWCILPGKMNEIDFEDDWRILRGPRKPDRIAELYVLDPEGNVIFTTPIWHYQHDEEVFEIHFSAIAPMSIKTLEIRVHGETRLLKDEGVVNLQRQGSFQLRWGIVGLRQEYLDGLRAAIVMCFSMTTSSITVGNIPMCTFRHGV